MFIDEALKIINKFIPNKENADQIELELRKLENEDFVNRKSLIDKIVPITFPLLVWIMSIGLIFNVIAPWISLFFKVETPIYQIEPYHYELIKWFMFALFGKKTIEKFAKK